MANRARTFDFAARFLPESRRHGAVVLYGFFRTLDDLVDERSPGLGVSAVRAELDDWRDWLTAPEMGPAPREPLGSLLAEVLATYRIPVCYLLELIDGLEADIDRRDITDDTELDRYCYQVASTVGLAMAHLLDATSAPALAAAQDLGAAMQLTNILRDVGEDIANDRVYLPKTSLASVGLTRFDLHQLHRRGRGPDYRLRALMRDQVERAHTLYQQGMSGIWLLPSDCRLPILIAARLYRRILLVIERNGYDTLRQRAATSYREKVQEGIIAYAIIHLWNYGERPAVPIAVATEVRDAMVHR